MRLVTLLLVCAMPVISVDALAFNAQKVLKKQGCLKCHAISRSKDGPSIKDISKKYRQETDGIAKLRTHLTSSPEIEVDGKKEKHKQFESKSDSDLDDVIEWILSK